MLPPKSQSHCLSELRSCEPQRDRRALDVAQLQLYKRTTEQVKASTGEPQDFTDEQGMTIQRARFGVSSVHWVVNVCGPLQESNL